MNDEVVRENPQRRFVSVDYGVLHDTEHFNKIYEKMVYIVLCKYADYTDKTSFPSISTIAKQAMCSETSVREALKHLQKVGLIKVEHRKDGARNFSNLYTILDVPDHFPKYHVGR